MKLSPKRKSSKNIRKSSKNIRKSSLKNKSFKQMTGGGVTDDFKISDKPSEDFHDYLNKCNLLIDIIDNYNKKHK